MQSRRARDRSASTHTQLHLATKDLGVGFRTDLAELVSAYSELTLQSIELGPLLRELIGFVRNHHLHIPPELVLLIRALVTIESVGRTLSVISLVSVLIEG